MKTPEAHERSAIQKYLKQIGAWYVHPMTYGFGISGAPDLVACIRGQLWGIEVKRHGKEPTIMQRNRMDEIEQAGGLTCWGTAERVQGHIDQWLQSLAVTSDAD